MTPSDRATALAVTVVAVVVLASGPIAGGLVQPSGSPTTLGDGTATVASVDVPTDELVVTPGRFGTGVAYVRVPDARVRLSSVTEQPRLVYRIEIPELSADYTATEIVTRPGASRLHVRDRGLDRSRLSADSYRATVTVRVQSFSTDRTVLRRNVTVEVRR